MDNNRNPFGPEDERAGFIPPDIQLDEYQADEARTLRLSQIQASGNTIQDAASFF